jgi:hypothetical protein
MEMAVAAWMEAIWMVAAAMVMVCCMRAVKEGG